MVDSVSLQPTSPGALVCGSPPRQRSMGGGPTPFKSGRAPGRAWPRLVTGGRPGGSSYSPRPARVTSMLHGGAPEMGSTGRVAPPVVPGSGSVERLHSGNGGPHPRAPSGAFLTGFSPGRWQTHGVPRTLCRHRPPPSGSVRAVRCLMPWAGGTPLPPGRVERVFAVRAHLVPSMGRGLCLICGVLHMGPKSSKAVQLGSLRACRAGHFGGLAPFRGF